MKRKLIILLVLVAFAFVGYKYVYQNHRNIKEEVAEYVIAAKTIADDFYENTEAAEKKYLNKTIEINGIITEVNKNDLTVNNSVFCQFNEEIKNSITVNSNITIKGRCIGYDDLLEQVKLDQSNIIQ